MVLGSLHTTYLPRALELAADWAPEPNIATASAGAVPTDLGAAVAELSSVYNGFFFFALDSFAEQADVDLSDHLNQKGLDTIESAANQCTVESLLSNAFIDTTTLTKDGTSLKQLVDEEFTEVIAEQKLSQAPIPDVPLLFNTVASMTWSPSNWAADSPRAGATRDTRWPSRTTSDPHISTVCSLRYPASRPSRTARSPASHLSTAAGDSDRH